MHKSVQELYAHARGIPAIKCKQKKCIQKRAGGSESPIRSGPAHWTRSPAEGWLKTVPAGAYPQPGLVLHTGCGRNARRDAQPQDCVRPLTVGEMPVETIRCGFVYTQHSTDDDPNSASSSASAHFLRFKIPPTCTGSTLANVVEPVHGKPRTR